MEEITFSQLAKDIKKGDYFVRKITGNRLAVCYWQLFKAKRGVFLDYLNVLRGLRGWSLTKDRYPYLRSIGECNRLEPISSYHAYVGGAAESSKFYKLSEEELQPLLDYLEKEKQKAHTKIAAKIGVKSLYEGVLNAYFDFPELKVGEHAFLTTRGYFHAGEENFLEINLNTNIPYLASDSIKTIEETILSKGEELGYNLSGVVLVPRNYSKGGYSAAGFKVRIFLDD